jgi:RNA polymerase sigma factor (sigma-70 family)
MQDMEDAELLVLAGHGDERAFEVLYTRYRPVALRLSRYNGMREESEDVVAQVFTDAWRLIAKGAGPTDNFQAYILTGVRHACGAWAKKRQRTLLQDDMVPLAGSVPFGGRLDPGEVEALRAAFLDLASDDWRKVLWLTAVEGQKPHEISDSLGMTPNAVSALAYRARKALRDAYYRQGLTPSELEEVT